MKKRRRGGVVKKKKRLQKRRRGRGVTGSTRSIRKKKFVYLINQSCSATTRPPEGSQPNPMLLVTSVIVVLHVA